MDASVTPGPVWTLENAYDHVYVAGEDVEDPDDLPQTLSQGDTIQWDSDRSVTAFGWQICFSEYVEPEPVPTSDYFTFSGDCDIVGDCISSSNYPDLHGNRESCQIEISQDASVTPGPTWELERGFDILEWRSPAETRDLHLVSSVPETMRDGDVLQWSSDGSITKLGWQLCFSDITTPEPAADCEEVTLRTRRYGNEISFSISGDVQCSGSNFESRSRNIPTGCCVSPSQSITLRCEDSYGDGWHRGYITINGVNYCRDFIDGYVEEINISP